MQTGWPGCYDELVFPTVFEGEAWNPKTCSEDDLWPCDVQKKQSQRSWILFNVRGKRNAEVALWKSQELNAQPSDLPVLG
mmetsp:Transcript_6006/g.21191  ORF Transcript_6006/g.21191 Transcript_6006/m.21191 type:complete len:80 (-) Transcript_6006:599-838(-)